MDAEHTYQVGELAGALDRAVGSAFPGEVWVRGEIRDLSRSSAGHVYFDLVDHDPEGEPAVLPVVLFASVKEVVNRYLMRTGAGRMTDGTEVRIRGFVSYYPRQARVQLRMTRIDAEYTLGRLAAERERLLRRLAAEGLLERNRSRDFPLVPLAVGLVTSAGSAAAADFLHELEASGFVFRVALADSRVQGPTAGESLARAVRAASAAGVDVVAVIRGGGSRTDLAAFDSEELARAVAASPVPVVTGIGHEGDESVVDRVAYRGFKTPTACAAALVEAVSAYLAAAKRAWDGVARRARVRLDRDGRSVANAGLRLARSTRGALVLGARQAVAAQRRLDRAAGSALASATRRLDAGEGLVRALDPARVLARGWTITRDGSGRLVRSSAAVAPGDELVTRFVDGSVRSRVSEPT